MPGFSVVVRTPFWSFCAGQMRIGLGQITDGTCKQAPSAGCVYFPPRCLPQFSSSVECPNTRPTTADDTTTTTTRDMKPGSFAIARPAPRVECVDSGHDGAVVLVSRARSFVWCVTPRGTRAFKTQAAAAAWWYLSWYGGRTKRHGVGFSSCSMIVLNIPRRLPWPNPAGSTRNVHNNSIQPFARTRSPTPVERCQPVVFWQWMVSTDTYGRSGYVGDDSVTLT